MSAAPPLTGFEPKRPVLAVNTSSSSHSDVLSSPRSDVSPNAGQLERDFIMSPLNTATPLRPHMQMQDPAESAKADPTPSERIFEQLDSIRELHRVIMKDHAKLEGLDTRGEEQRGAVDGSRADDAREEREKESDNEKDKEGKTGPASYEQMATDFGRRQNGVERIMRQVRAT